MLVSCSEAPKFPAKYIYEVDLQNDVCGKYEIIDSKKMTVRHVADLSLSQCQGVFGFSSKDIPKIFDWSADVQKMISERCK